MFKHLLPTGRAWSLTENKPLRLFFQALDVLRTGATAFADFVFLDIFPSYTRALGSWEDQFGLTRNAALSDAERRQRLTAAWRATGGQAPRYLQDLLNDAGFNVYVHEWFDPATVPPVGDHTQATARNPLTVIAPEYATAIPGVDCGEALAACGEAFAECGNRAVGVVGYPLVNKFVYDAEAAAYIVPSDPQYWPYFIYVGGEAWGDVADVPATRRYEFEELLLKYRPAQQWIGVVVRYI